VKRTKTLLVAGANGIAPEPAAKTAKVGVAPLLIVD
jgi:hypothetical protein